MSVTHELGATPLADRRPAPDLARGGMLLLIALANVHVYVYGSPIGPRGYPRALDPADQVVTLLQLTLVDGRAYPLFGLLFGYGITQLARRRIDVRHAGRPGRADRAAPRRVDGGHRVRARRRCCGRATSSAPTGCWGCCSRDRSSARPTAL